MSEQSHKFDEAVIRQWTWKTPAMKQMTLAICRLALARNGAEFSANDLPEFEHGGTGICGSIFKRLIADKIIKAVGFQQGGAFLYKVVFNKGGNKIGVYCLASEPLARALLAIHEGGDAATGHEATQIEMI